jgi:hypothetical protein
MQKAVEKAIDNGFDWIKLFATGAPEQRHHVLGVDKIKVFITTTELYWLIFGTDFLDKLVGKRPGCKYNIEGYCDSAPKKRYADKCNPNCDGYGFGWRSPSYHRSQLANLKDIEDIKAYVEGLV